MRSVGRGLGLDLTKEELRCRGSEERDFRLLSRRRSFLSFDSSLFMLFIAGYLVPRRGGTVGAAENIKRRVCGGWCRIEAVAFTLWENTQ